MISNKRELSEWIAKQTWKFAKTMPHIPHWYCVRAEVGNDAEFNRVCEILLQYGKPESFGKRTFKYYYIDGFKYWVMTDVIADNGVINRAKA